MKEIGDLLRRRREELGLSYADVHERIKIRPGYLCTLEEGEFDAAPGEVYLKGFLRSYADFLGLDGSGLVQRYKELRQRQEVERQQELEARARREKGGAGRRLPPASAVGRFVGRRVPTWLRVVSILALTAALAVLVWRFYLVSRRPGSSGAPAAPPEPASVVLATPEGGGAAERAGAVAGTGGGPPQPGAEPQVEAGRGTPAGAKPQPAATGGEEAARAAAGTGTHSLVVEVRARCWIRVESDGARVFEGTVQAGGRREFRFRSSAAIRFGNAGGVILTYDGKRSGPPGRDGEVLEMRWPPGKITRRSSRAQPAAG